MGVKWHLVYQEQWLMDCQHGEILSLGEAPHAGKQAVVEVCFIGTALIATIETVVFAALFVLGITVSVVTCGCVQVFARLAGRACVSSAEALGLSVTGLVYNFTRDRLRTFEQRRVITADAFIERVVAGGSGMCALTPEDRGQFGGMTDCDYWLGTCLVYRLVYGDLIDVRVGLFPRDLLREVSLLQESPQADFRSPLTEEERAFLSVIPDQMPEERPGRLQACYRIFNASIAQGSQRFNVQESPWKLFFDCIAAGAADDGSDGELDLEGLRRLRDK